MLTFFANTGLLPERHGLGEPAMPAFIAQFVNAIKGIWLKMSVIQRVAVAAGAVVLLSAIIGLSVWMGRPEYRVLYSNLGPEDASHVVKALRPTRCPINSLTTAPPSWFQGRWSMTSGTKSPARVVW